MAKSVAKNSAFNMINKGISVVFPLITVSYISRILGATGVGEISSAQNLSTYFCMAAALGIPSYGVRAIAQTKHNKDKCNTTFSELILTNLISTIISFLLYWGVLWILRDNYPNIILSIVFSITILFNVINIEWLYQGFEEYGYITIRSFVIKILSIVLMVLFVHKETDLVKYALIICFGSIGNYVLNLVNYRKYVSFRLSRMSLRRHIVPITTFFLSVIAIEIYSLLDVTMLTAMTNKACVGYYSNSAKVVKAVANTLTGLSAVLMPRFSSLFSENNKNEIKILSRKYLNVTFLISIPSCLGLIMVADTFVNVLFGPGFEPAAATIKILSLLIVLMPLSGGVFCQLILTSGAEKRYLICVLCGTIINICLNSLLIPVYYQNGAAIASILGEAAVTLSMIIVSRRIVKVGMNWRDIISIGISGCLMVMSIKVINIFMVGLADWIVLVCDIAVAALVYFAFIVLLKNSALLDLLKKIKKR